MPILKATPVGDSVAKINGEVAVGEDLDFQRRWWRFERTAWLFFIVVLALDFAGLFGRGPLSKGQMHVEDGSFSVMYERIERTGTPSLLTVTLQAPAFVNGVATLFISDDLVEGLGAQRVIPQPASTVVGDKGLTYTFPGQSFPAKVRIELQPVGPGIYPISIRVTGHASLSTNVWVMP